MLQKPIFLLLNDTQARLIWNDIEEGVSLAIDNTPGNEIKDIKRYVMTASARVVGVYDKNRTRFGSIIFLPMGHNAYIVSIEGKGFVNKDNGVIFDNFMKDLGFKTISCLAAPAQERLWKRLGYKSVKTLMEKNIWAE